MKVLMTADAIGGVWQYAIELIRAFEPHGIEVILATMGGGAPDADQQRQVSELSNAQLFVGDFKLEWMHAPWKDVAAASDWLLELEARHEPDLIHLNGYVHGALPWRAPLLIVGHSCVLSWWRAVKGTEAPGAYDEYRRRVTEGLRGADAVAAPSRNMLDALNEHYGPLPPGHVIYNARDARAYSPARKERFILAAGRLWDEAKNLKGLERIAPELPWPLYLAGEERGPGGSAVTTHGARHLGRLSAGPLSDWLARAAIFAHPALYEPFGLAALEAGLSGCALVLGDIPSLREIWTDAAVFVPPADPQAVGAAIRGLIDRPVQRALYGQRALSRARAYVPQTMGQKYFGLYRELMAGSAAASSCASEEARASEEPTCVS